MTRKALVLGDDRAVRAYVLTRTVRQVVAPGGPQSVFGYKCRWCGWEIIGDGADRIPDHECPDAPDSDEFTGDR